MHGIYRRGENFYCDVTFHGKRVRKMLCPSRKVSERIVSKIKADIAEEKFLQKRREPPKNLFGDFAKEYLGWIKANRSDRSYRGTVSLMKPILETFRDKKMDEITAWEIEQFRSRRKKTLKNSSSNRETALVKTMYNRGISWGKCFSNPAKSVKLLREDNQRVKYLVPEEVERLIECCDDLIRPIVIVAVNSGFRKNELISLEWDRIDLDRGAMSLLQTKSGKRRDVPINAAVRSVLEKMEGREGRVFRKKNGEPFRYSTVRKPFEKAVRLAGLTDLVFHDLRSVFASTLISRGADINGVRELLGHSDLKMTLRYLRFSPDYAKETVSRLDGVFEASPDLPREEGSGNVVPISSRKDTGEPLAQQVEQLTLNQ